jgi:hypothetical protein
MAKKQVTTLDNVYIEKPVQKSFCCESCGSVYFLSFLEDEVTGNPVKCPFCGDFCENQALDFDNDPKNPSYERLASEWENTNELLDFDRLVDEIEDQ